MKVERRSFLSSGLAFAAAGDAISQTRPTSAVTGLRSIADSKGLWCGTYLDYAWFSDRRIYKALTEDANILNPGAGFNMTRVMPTLGSGTNFHEAEKVYRISQANKQAFRGRLVWHGSTPGWVDELARTSSCLDFERTLEIYLRQVSRYWRGRLEHVEVVNEPVNGAGLVGFSIASKLGERYIDLAAQVSYEENPTASRWINQDWVEMDSPEHSRRRKQFLRLLERLKKRDVKIDGIGIQGHLLSRFKIDPNFSHFLKEVSNFGLDILITEFDVLDNHFSRDIKRRDRQVAALGSQFLELCLDNPRCRGVMTWGLSDAYSWLAAIPGKQRADHLPLRPLPLDDQFRRKPLWYSIASAMQGASSR